MPGITLGFTLFDFLGMAQPLHEFALSFFTSAY
jgi:hypothetical protein